MRTAAFQRLNNVLGLDTPAPGFVGISRERARRSPARGSQRLQPPLGPPKSRLGRPDFFTAKRESRQRRSSLPGPGLFSATRPAETARFLITRGKASFYETATFGRRKVSSCSPFCGLLFCPARAKLALPAGKSPPPQTRPLCAAAPNDRDRLPVFAPPARTPAPATPPQSACSRRLSGCPQRPNLFGRRLPESPKGKGKRKEEARMPRPPPVSHARSA